MLGWGHNARKRFGDRKGDDDRHIIQQQQQQQQQQQRNTTCISKQSLSMLCRSEWLRNSSLSEVGKPTRYGNVSPTPRSLSFSTPLSSAESASCRTRACIYIDLLAH